MTPRERHLLRTYGITEAYYVQLLEAQSFKCAVCRRPATDFKIRLSVDHNHETGEIRGLLCTHCNRTIIGRTNDAELLKRGGEYLAQGLGIFVPLKTKKKKRKKKSRST